jgi:hypothetical protein
MLVMTIQAVVFDIGGVLEITPDLGVTGMWESRLGLGPGELDKRMSDVWRGGSIGTISERDVHQAVSEILGLAERQLTEFMADIWREYLGDRQHRTDRVRSPAAPAIPHGDPEQQLRRCQGTRTGCLRVRRPR